MGYNRKWKLRKKCLYSEFFWSVFSRIWTECRDLQSKSPYSGRMWEIKTRKTLGTDTFHALKALQKCYYDTKSMNLLAILLKIHSAPIPKLVSKASYSLPVLLTIVWMIDPDLSIKKIVNTLRLRCCGSKESSTERSWQTDSCYLYAENYFPLLIATIWLQ